MDMARLLPLIIILLLLLNSLPCRSDDQLTQAKPLSPGDKLISENGVFALGFFSPTNSNKSLYIGIWYHGIPEHTQCGSPTATTLPQAQPLHQRSSPSPTTKAWCCRTPKAAYSLDNSSEHHRRRWSGCRGATQLWELCPPVGERNRPPMAELRSPGPHHPSNHEGTRGVCLRAERLVRRPRR